jgi:DNA-binding NarL/FixJ family response regulator
VTENASPAETPARNVLIVDDHPLVRQGIATLISQEADLAVSGEAESAHEALEAMAQAPPDVAVVDLTLKDSSGLELIKDIRIRFPNVRVLVLSMRDEGFYAERVLRAGALGYVTKAEPRQRIIEGIRKVLAGRIYVSEKMATKVMGKIVAGGGEPGGSPIGELTDRELEVFELIGGGLATREIARKLHISPKTVDSHREHIKQKLKLDTAADLSRHAIQWVQCQKNM